jgi:putative PIN family toxin of toxin-antitoxin system
MSLRAVLDTNVLISAVLTPNGRPELVLRLALTGSFQLVASDELFFEYEEVLARPEFRLPRKAIKELMAEVRKKAVIVSPETLPEGVCSDADDAKVLGTAVAGKVNYLITGNLKHFPKSYRDVEVVNPKEFLGLI